MDLIGFSKKTISKFQKGYALLRNEEKLLDYLGTDAFKKTKTSIVTIDSNTLLSVTENIVKILKVAQVVLTDENFTLESFVDKIEPMIKENVDLAPIAKIKFIRVS